MCMHSYFVDLWNIFYGRFMQIFFADVGMQVIVCFPRHTFFSHSQRNVFVFDFIVGIFWKRETKIM